MTDFIIMKQGIRSDYDRIVTPNPNTLYYCTDTGEIFLGSVNMSQTNTHTELRLEPTAEKDFDTLFIEACAELSPKVSDIISAFDITTGKGTTYVYTGAWTALHIDAEDVVFSSDMLFTKNFGKYEVNVTTGSVTIPSRGKNVRQVFMDAFSEAKNPSITDPSIEISTNKSAQYEVGTTIDNIEVTATLNKGSYTWGPVPTGVKVREWLVDGVVQKETVVDPEDPESTIEATVVTDSIVRTFNEGGIKIKSGDNIITQIGCNYDEGNKALNNLGDPSDVYIPATTTAINKNVNIVGYYSNFYGSSTEIQSITSETIRNLMAPSSDPKVASSVNITTSWLQFIYAVPSGRKTNMTAKNASTGLPLDVVKQELQVVDGSGVDTQKYNVFVINLKEASSPCKLELSWS